MSNCEYGRTVLQDPAPLDPPDPVECPSCGSRRRPLVETKKRPEERQVAVFPTHNVAGAASALRGKPQRTEAPTKAKSAAGPGDIIRFRDWSGGSKPGKVAEIHDDVVRLWDDQYRDIDVMWTHTRFIPHDRILRVTSRAAA